MTKIIFKVIFFESRHKKSRKQDVAV